MRLGPSLALLTALLLAACAARPPLPAHVPALTLPTQWLLQREADGMTTQSLLVIQAEGDALRWSQLDPLGVPLARQRLRDGQWQADGLLPPNPEARELFAALLFAWTPTPQLARSYAGQRWVAQGAVRELHWGARVWRVQLGEDRQLRLDVRDADATRSIRYEVAPLDTDDDRQARQSKETR